MTLSEQKKSSNSNVYGISASEFNQYFSTIGNKVSSRLPKQGVPKWKNPPPIYSFIFEEIDVASVHGDLHSLDDDSSNDVLQLDAKLLRMSADVICRTLTNVYNISLSSKIIPGEWKLARITPIYKGSGDVHRETNYRSISVLSHVAKIFERNVHEQIVNYLEHHCFITPYQSAYLKKHSTVTCLHRVYWWHVREYWWRTCLWCVFPGYWKMLWYYRSWHPIAEIKMVWYRWPEMDWLKNY